MNMRYWFKRAVQKTAVLALPCVFLSFSGLSWAVPLSQQYQQLQTRVNTLTVAAVLHFVVDPRPGGSPDKLGQANLQAVERQVRQQAAGLGLTSSALDVMLANLETLSTLSPDETNYQLLLVEILDQHGHLSGELSSVYQQLAVTPLAEQLNRQSRRVALLRLHALTRNARILGHHSLNSDAVFAGLDREIEQGFVQLEEMLPESLLSGLRRHKQAYQFVRATLLDTNTPRVSAALEHYVANMLDWLDATAVEAEGQS